MISFIRVDNRLIHGQVVEAWLPHLRVRRVVVADAEASQSPLIRAAMSMAVHDAVEVIVAPPSEVDYQALESDAKPTLVLLRDVANVEIALHHGLHPSQINLGNVHFRDGRRQVSASVFLDADELARLKSLAAQGVAVEARGVPSEKPLGLADLTQRFENASAPGA